MAYTPVLGVVSQMQVRERTAVDDGPEAPAPLPSPITEFRECDAHED